MPKTILKCPKCPMTFVQPKAFKNHLEKKHGDDDDCAQLAEERDIYQCGTCYKSYPHSSSKTRHEKDCDGDPEPALTELNKMIPWLFQQGLYNDVVALIEKHKAVAQVTAIPSGEALKPLPESVQQEGTPSTDHSADEASSDNDLGKEIKRLKYQGKSYLVWEDNVYEKPEDSSNISSILDLNQVGELDDDGKIEFHEIED